MLYLHRSYDPERPFKAKNVLGLFISIFSPLTASGVAINP